MSDSVVSQSITFWLGCNVLRHGDIIHACVDILQALEIDAKVVGGPDYCCGTSKDANLTAAAGMAKRTTQNLNNTGQDRVVAWCPSCHVHMTDVISQAHQTGFSLSHFTELLYEHRDRLKPLLKQSVPLRVVIHEHHGFDRDVAVNAMTAELLGMIPGVSVISTAVRAPGYMCAPLVGMPKVMQQLGADTLAAAKEAQADALVTIFHQCHREWLGLAADGHIEVFNYIHLLARSMGIEYEDEYRTWKNAGKDAKSLIGAARVAKVGEALIDRALLPEFARRPYKAEP
jgi:Fe-S oxidoreductase